jgi:predicted membrane-bound dolichyl-phosphate-mannose-protein mannosyltransferase
MIILTIAFAYESFTLANNMQGTLGYVSDECWYASSSKNILRELFNVQPSYISDGYYHYSIFFNDPSDLANMIPSLNSTLNAQYGGYILPTTYNNTLCLNVVTQKPLNEQSIKDSIQGIELIQAGYKYPDIAGIENYMNTEHPPLAKYIIGFSMLSLGDKPISWRIPSIILGTLMLVLICLIVYKLTDNLFIVFLIFLFAFVDSIFMAMSSVAMLDIYAAFFLTLSAWLALRNNFFLSAVSLGLSASSKLTGVFPVIALLIYMLVIRFDVIKSFVYPLIVSPAVYVSVNIPLILHYGFKNWVSQVENGSKWDITNRPTGPPVSTPWGWFYNQNPFALNFKPDVIAKVDPVIYIMALVMLVFIPYIYFKINKKYLIPTLWFLAGFFGFVGVYLLGNKTQYSFYVITLTPMVYVLAAAFIYYLTEPWTFKDALKSYYAFIKRTPKSQPIQVQDIDEDYSI